MGISKPTLAVGNLQNRRSLLDVRDQVQALWLAASDCVPGEVYNVGGDSAYSVEELIAVLRPLAAVRFQVEQRPELMRSVDELVIAGDNSKFQKCCDWQPNIPVVDTLRGMLEWWRARLSNSATSPLGHESARIQSVEH